MNKIIFAFILFFSSTMAFAGISEDESIALVTEHTGKGILDKVKEIDFYFIRQKSMVPLTDVSRKPDISIFSEKKIKLFFKNIWHNAAMVSEKWTKDDSAVVVIAKTSETTYAYFHIYLICGSVPLITPYTGSDPATYEIGSITAFLSFLE